jgi:quercetin dioxygenase-like cupin family protein
MKLKVIPWREATAPVEETLRERLEAEAFSVFRWRDAPGATYTPHSHGHDESLWVIEGEISFGIGGQTYRLGVGDRLMLPRGTEHTATAGPAGATYLIAEK